jgi:ATP-dependent DNA helicase RecQ
VYALKTLEQEGWLSYAEQIFLPSRVVFTSSKRTLEEFEAQNPKLEPVIKGLLRTYGGIFDMECIISEKQLVAFIKADLDFIKQSLIQLHQFGILQYTPQKEKPQLQFLQSRVPVEQLFINPATIANRKQQFEARVQQMIRYTSDNNQCRSKTIGLYFGDEHSTDCGVCDVCLWKKGNELSPTEFTQLQQQILHAATEKGIVVKEFISRLGSKQKERVWKVIDHLVAEEKLVLSEDGLLKKK